ncbi:MAG: replicative DNA helicase [Actinobacteria bacterium]|nr:replicative DNA helicase [Actinomycetota bacterium]
MAFSNDDRGSNSGPGGGNRQAPRRNEGRVPPHNLNAEESLLGALLLSRDVVGNVAELGLLVDHFYKPAHQHIYAAVRGLMTTGQPIDVVTVADELRRAGLLDEIGGPQFLLELQNATPAISNANRYAKIVQDTAVLRRMISVASEIAELAYMEPDDVTKALDEAETKMFEVAEDRVIDSTRPLSDLLPLAMDKLQETFDRGDTITGVATGFNDLDEIMSGLQPSTLNIVGARPAMGKCVAWDTPMVDPLTGEVRTAEAWFEAGAAGSTVWCTTLDDTGAAVPAPFGGFYSDGSKPLFRVTTRSGRTIRITEEHPLLTGKGWRPLRDITVGDRIAVPRALEVFGDREMVPAELDLLALLLGDGSIGAGRTTPAFTTANEPALDVARRAAADLGAELRFGAPAGAAATWRIVGGDRGGRRSNPVTDMLRRHGAWGANAHDKRVPAAVFTAPREQVARFLNRLFATDGTAWVAAAGYARIGYGTVSEQLSLDVFHLLLRFGIRAKRRERSIAYRGERRRAFEVEIMDAVSLRAFAAEIGILGKEAAVQRVVDAVEHAQPSFTADSLPIDVWDDVVKAKGERSWAEISRAAGKPSSHNWHPYRRSPRRETIALLAEVLDCDVLRRWASPDVSWDAVVQIESCGWDRIYDFNVPGTHNFVAADVFVHNTAFGLGMATHIAMTAKKPALFFSLEMGHAELTQRILSSEARVDSQKLRTGRLVDSDWTKIGRAINRLEVPLFLDDNPRVTVMEIRAKARRMKARYGGIALIVIDYLQLMSGGSNSENRQLEVSEISRGLKILARELEVPIVALSQLSRNLEARADKRPMLADLRESGSLEQDADVVMFLYRDEVYNRETPDKGLAEVIIAKHRSGPTGVVRLVFNGAYTRYDNAAKGLN